MRDYTEENGGPDIELEKFIINSILSAANTEDMDSSDQNDIISKIETGGDDDSTEDEFGGEEVDDDFEEKGEEETDEGLMREIDWEARKRDDADDIRNHYINKTNSYINNTKDTEIDNAWDKHDMESSQDPSVLPGIEPNAAEEEKLVDDYLMDEDLASTHFPVYDKNHGEEEFTNSLDPKLYPDGWKEMDGMFLRNSNDLSNSNKSLNFEENNDMELNQMIDEMLGNPAEAPVKTPTETPVERPTETPNPVDDPRYSPFNPPKPNENPDPKGKL